MSIMHYSAEASREVKASIVNINITINTADKDVSKAIAELNEKRKTFKELILSKKSLIKNSYKQTTINTRKCYKDVTITKNGVEVRDKEFDTYRASSYVSCILENNDTVINDFIDLYNVAIKSESNMNYIFNITDEERDQVLLELTAEAIDSGIKDIKTIIDKSKSLVDLIPVISVIGENPDGEYGGPRMKAKCLSSDRAFYNQEETLITPDLVSDIFANKLIPISVSLYMKVELKSSRSI